MSLFFFVLPSFTNIYRALYLLGFSHILALRRLTVFDLR